MDKNMIQQDMQKVSALLNKVLKVNRYNKIERMGGHTNRTYHVILFDGKEYVVRIPGEGTNELIVRKDEKISTELVCNLGIDAELLYFDKDGFKVTKYIPNAITMSTDSMKEECHIKQIAEIFKKLHQSGVDTGVPFEVFDMAANYEKIINKNNITMYDDYLIIKVEIMKIKQKMDSICKIKKVSCHNDPLCENWIESNGRMYLIDWEYAGMNDGMWDLADISIEASYDKKLELILLQNYLGHRPEQLEWKHFMANKIYVDYLWTLWAKTRVVYDGQWMEDWAIKRYTRLKKNLKAFKNIP